MYDFIIKFKIMKLKIILPLFLLLFSCIPNNLDSNNNIMQKSDKPLTIEEKLNIKKPDMIIDETKNYEAILYTNKGEIKINLFEKATPITVNNFVYLALENFYNDVIFHRIIKDFMIQTGDPKGDGTGGPGYRFDDEDFDGEYTKGTVAMANAGPNTNGSQFFIMHENTPLPKAYVIFGEVIEGLDVIEAIANVKVERSTSGDMSYPTEVITINSIDIIEK